jgi:VanZ like family
MNPNQFAPRFEKITGNMRLLLISVLFILLCTLFPFQFSSRSFTELLGGFEQRLDVQDFLLNIVLFLPLGMSLSGLLSQKRWKKLLLILGICAGLSISVELLQLFLPGRNPNLLDVISNSLGGILGYLSQPRFGKKLGAYFQRIAHFQPPMKWLLAAFLGYFAMALSIIMALSSPSSLANWDTAMPLLLGNEKTGDRPWSGFIESVYIADRALSESEVATALTNRTFDFKDSQVAAYPLLDSGEYSDLSRNLPELVWQGAPSPQTGQGVALDATHWLTTVKPATRLSKRLIDTSQFTLMTAIATTHFDQTGPARIISLSESPFSRNLTLGQADRDLEIRL